MMPRDYHRKKESKKYNGVLEDIIEKALQEIQARKSQREDIRKYFGSSSSKPVDNKEKPKTVQNKRKSLKSTKKNPVIFDSDDEDPLPTKIRRKSSKLVVLASDSDSDENNTTMPSKKKRKAAESSPKKKTPTKSKKPDSTKRKSPIKKPTTVDDFFGSALVVQSKVKSKTKKVLDVKPSLKKSEKHDDEDFDKTLKQVDENELAPKSKKLNGHKSYVRPKNETEATDVVPKSPIPNDKKVKTDIASKLSKKAKASIKKEIETEEPSISRVDSKLSLDANTPVKSKNSVKSKAQEKIQNTSIRDKTPVKTEPPEEIRSKDREDEALGRNCRSNVTGRMKRRRLRKAWSRCVEDDMDLANASNRRWEQQSNVNLMWGKTDDKDDDVSRSAGRKWHHGVDTLDNGATNNAQEEKAQVVE
ncbi:hypothetical protein GQR58_012083 [Nymphon striatum]|nr:hypothetical protein GQR58_012083 [Nymphon striatum]